LRIRIHILYYYSKVEYPPLNGCIAISEAIRKAQLRPRVTLLQIFHTNLIKLGYSSTRSFEKDLFEHPAQKHIKF